MEPLGQGVKSLEPLSSSYDGSIVTIPLASHRATTSSMSRGTYDNKPMCPLAYGPDPMPAILWANKPMDLCQQVYGPGLHLPDAVPSLLSVNVQKLPQEWIAVVC